MRSPSEVNWAQRRESTHLMLISIHLVDRILIFQINESSRRRLISKGTDSLSKLDVSCAASKLYSSGQEGATLTE